VANGNIALYSNTTGNHNTATGGNALYYNTTGTVNTADGQGVLTYNTTGIRNTGTGVSALFNNTIGNENTATGYHALPNNSTGNDNTGDGPFALGNNTTGSRNIGIGFLGGNQLTTGDDNIDIGHSGFAAEARTIRIGNGQTAAFIAGISGSTVPGGVAVVVDGNGHLGTVVSSQRYKEEIKPMEKSSEALLALKPVTFRYKHELDPNAIPQFGLVAEEVEKVNPDLVARDAQGKVFTVRYEAVNAMLLNEFLKEHRKVEKLEATVAQQQKGIEVLTASVKEQASQIQRVSDRLELNKPAPRVAHNNH